LRFAAIRTDPQNVIGDIIEVNAKSPHERRRR
jgi:hypothetical protein